MSNEERKLVAKFLDAMQQRIVDAPNRIGFEPVYGNLVINWMRAIIQSDHIGVMQ